MKNFTVCFTSPHFTNPEVFLNTIIKMTPGKSGIWKNMTAITDPMKADFVVCVDGYPNHKYPIERTLFFAQHPQGISAFKSMSDVKGKALGVFPANTDLCMGEWWISHDYDTLMAMEPPKKEKDLISITTYRWGGHKTYEHRIQFLESYVKQSKNIDIYGRQTGDYKNNRILADVFKGHLGVVNYEPQSGDHIKGKDILQKYRYSLDFDHGNFTDGAPVKNYFSERFFDSMLLWCMPIYFGCDNVHTFLPENSFRYVDIRKWNNPEEAKRVLDIVNSDFREQNIEALREARQLLLNKYQTWAMAYNKILEITGE